jgi:CRISPR-associated protein Cas5d
MKNPEFFLRIRGGMACFTRPEFSTERLSYELMTPSAARGVIEAVLWKPAVRWEITSIALLSPVRWIEFRRNEVNSRVSTQNALRASRGGEPLPEFFSDEDRAQRNTLALREPDYGVTARLHMTQRAGEEDTLEKFRAMFLRRMEKGQQHYQPYLGCREFPATIELWDVAKFPPLATETRELGWMLHDIDFGPQNQARFFPAQLKQGVMSIPEWQSSVAGGTL